ncbi:response regulator transcription factor [soil metagenome]
MNIAIVEDERKLTETLSEGLEAEGYTVTVFFDGESFKATQTKDGLPFDLVVLDLGLPGISGLEVCQWLRQSFVTLPILMLTAHDTIADKVRALDNGADDFLAKPFNFEELMARLRALTRRAQANQLKVMFEDLSVDARTREVTRAGTPIVLTPTEFDLLLLLVESQGKTLSREEISKKLWDVNDISLSNIVDVHISNLRKKIDDGHATKRISTVRGLGYRLA